MSTDLIDTRDELLLLVELPGVGKDAFKLTVINRKSWLFSVDFWKSVVYIKWIYLEALNSPT